MSILATLLIAVGLADLTRSLLDAAGTAARAIRLVAMAVGVVTVGVVAGLAGLLTPSGTWLLALAAVTVAAWVVASDGSLPAPRGHVAALLTLGLGIVVQLVLSGWAPSADGPLGSWLEWARLPWHVAPDRALLVTGLALVQLSTGNVIVRLVLISTGAMAAAPSRDEPSEELKGGRLLGPLERLFIVGLGIAGQVTAAGLVIAAKGLIRWPELTAHSRADASRVDKLTEYFLVGSFVSWLVALAALVLAQ